MNIGLDYDDTYTRDPYAWEAFITLMKKRGHNVYIVTWRDVYEAKEVLDTMLDSDIEGIYATNRKAKQRFMLDHNICIDVWIDDNPFAILNSMVPYTASTWE